MINNIKQTIYYFSGTGNARNVAHWIKSTSEELNEHTDLIDISKLKRRKNLKVHPGNIIGFCSPTHGFNFPPIMFHFLLRFPRSKNNSAYIINTRAGMKAGKLFLPGISGLAQYFSAFILLLKGYKIIGMYPVDLPSNWISFHPGIKENVIQSIYKKRKYETIRFTKNILNERYSYKGLRAIVIDILISPIAFLYYIVGRFVLAKSFYASHKCTQCNLCIKNCPVQAIKTIDKRPFWTYKCESCMRCMNTCPERAIETAHGFVIPIYYLITSFLLIKIYKLLDIHCFLNNIFPDRVSNIIEVFIDSALIVFLFIIFYRIFHYLLRFKFFERIILYTSFTYWKFWRRYKIRKDY